jgi:hypothetical protein
MRSDLLNDLRKFLAEGQPEVESFVHRANQLGLADLADQLDGLSESFDELLAEAAA